MTTLNINGKRQTVTAEPDTPLLWVLRDELHLNGTKFGCGMALCGACTVHLDGQPVRACVTPISAAAGHKITTIEAIGATPVGQRVQQAWAALDVPQCGYCQSGQIMAAHPARDPQGGGRCVSSSRFCSCPCPDRRDGSMLIFGTRPVIMASW